MSKRVALLVAIGLLAATTADAAEVRFDGAYRVRGRMFSNLSIDGDLANKEGLSAWAQHRFWLRPRIVIDEHVGVFADIKGLDGVSFGNQPNPQIDDATGASQSLAWTDDLTAPTSASDERSPLLDFTLWHVWGEVHSKIGTFKAGRMPLHWGSGVWQNDGMGENADFGDSADRIQYEVEVSRVFIRAAFDTNAENLVNDKDDVYSINLAGAYRDERLDAGVQLQYRHLPKPTGGQAFNLFTADAAATLQLGRVDGSLEVVGQFGGGDLDAGQNDVTVSSVGGVLEAGVQINRFRLGANIGYASGDGTPNDQRVHTFSFDRDYNIGLMMFEQPLPALQAGEESGDEDGRDLSNVLTGNGVSNAMYGRAAFGADIIDGLEVEASVLAARVAKLPNGEEFNGRSSYGVELGLETRYSPFKHVDLVGRGGAFFPGTWYREFSDETFPDGFRGSVIGGELMGRIHF